MLVCAIFLLVIDASLSNTAPALNVAADDLERQDRTLFDLYLPLAIVSDRNQADATSRFIVHGISTRDQRSEIAEIGAAIEAVGDEWIEIVATPGEVAAIKALVYRVEQIAPPIQIQDEVNSP